MTIKIVPDMVPMDHPIIGKPMTPLYIVIHNTGNPDPGANAAMHGRYLLSPEAIQREVLWHFTVDDHEVRQHLPTNINGWHASDGETGPGNTKGIAIEICEYQGIDMAQAEARAAALCAYLIQTVPSLLPFPDCMKQHYDFARDKKNCPHVIRDRPGGWEGFVGLVKADLAQPKGPFTDVEPGAWYAQDLTDLKEMGIIRGLPDGRFAPDRPATRAEVAAMIRRAVRMITGR